MKFDWSFAFSAAVAFLCVFLAWALGRWENRRAHKLALFSATLGIARELMEATADAVDHARVIGEAPMGLRRPAIVAYAESMLRFSSAILVASPFLPDAVIGPAYQVHEKCQLFRNRLWATNPEAPMAEEKAVLDSLPAEGMAVRQAMQDWFRALVPTRDLGTRAGAP
jgi:hypothetical protein